VAVEGTTAASESDSSHNSTTDGETGTESSTVTDIGFDSGSGYSGSYTEVDSEGGSVTDHNQKTDTDSDGADAGSDQLTNTEQDNASASFTRGGTYVVPLPEMSVTFRAQLI
jgi:hypothetical protein